jgi:hypothetical protein
LPNNPNATPAEQKHFLPFKKGVFLAIELFTIKHYPKTQDKMGRAKKETSQKQFYRKVLQNAKAPRLSICKRNVTKSQFENQPKNS